MVGTTAQRMTFNLELGRNIIKKVTKTKFLGVYIDEKLSWQPHIKYLNSKLKCEIGKINAIRNIIPSELYNNLYHTLFESHLSYGISAWGGVSRTSIEPLFITQKKCIRVLFGNRIAYLEKFNTCARTRTYGNQMLGTEFYEHEHSKPLFKKYNFLTVHNLYKYHCLLEMFKIVKLRKPVNLNLNDHFWISNISTGKTGTTSTLTLTILYYNYVLYIYSNLINVLQNANLTGNTLCNTYALYDNAIVPTNGTHLLLSGKSAGGSSVTISCLTENWVWLRIK